MKYVRITFVSFILIISTMVSGNTSISADNDSLPIDSISTKENTVTKYVTIQYNLPARSKNYFSGIISICSLLIGFFIGKIYDNWESKKKIKSEGKIWLETFIQLQEPLDNQIKSITRYLEENPINTYKMGNPEFQLSLDCYEFKSLNDKSIIPYLQKEYRLKYKKSIKLAGQLKNNVRIIENASNVFNDSFKELKSNSGVHFNRFLSEFPEFKKHFANYLDEISHSKTASSVQTTLAKKINALGDKYILSPSKTGDMNLFELSEKFVPEFLKASNDDRNHPELIAAVESLTKCDQSIKNMMSERYYWRENLKNIQTSYQMSLDRLKTIINELGLNEN